MRKLSKWIYGVGICILSAAVLAGCGDGTGEGNSDIPAYGRTEETSRSSEEQLIMNYEIKYSNGGFLMEDYKELAELYAKVGQIRKQRDLLEQSFRLYEDRQAFETLQGLYVNLAEEEADIQEQAALMLRNLEAGEYRGESIHMIESDEWFYTMMPKMGEGVRNYFLQEEGQTRLLIRVGYDEEGTPFSTVWYHGENDSITLLKKISGTVRIMDTSFKEGAYEGPFTLWILDGVTGSILKEQGTFSGGSYAGEYTLDIYQGAGEGDPFDLWNNRENMEYTSHTGQMDEQGQGNIKQFAAEFETYPVFEVYEPVENRNDSEESGTASSDSKEAVPQVRIYDGVIQVMSGTAWISLGDVEGYMKEDPFRVYAELRQEKDAGIQNNGLALDDIVPADTGIQETTPSVNQPAPTPTPSVNRPASTPAPSVNRPVSTPAPSVNRPAPTPEPAPAPVPDDDDDDDDDGSSGDNNDNGGSGNDNNGDDGGSDNSGDSGNDVDIEWTDDIL